MRRRRRISRINRREFGVKGEKDREESVSGKGKRKNNTRRREEGEEPKI